jgi:amino acid adenylation domain-containing protein
VQVISPEVIVTFDVCDLSGLESEVESSALEQLALEAACSDNEPDAAPLNALLVTFSPHDHHLWLNLPSMTADTHSLNNMARELMRCYESCAKATALPDEPLDYLQFSEWQNELLLDVDQAANGRAYWQQFGSKAEIDQLRFRQVNRFQPAVVEVSFTADEVAQIEAYGAAHSTGACAVWLGCWQALLWSTTGARQVVLGYVAEGRRYEEMSDGLGLYAKWLPVAVDVDQERGLHEIVGDASDAMSAAAEQQDYFVLEGGTEESRSFVIGYEYEERWEGAETVGVHFNVREQRVELEPYELKLHCVKQDGRVRAELRYDPEVYEEAEVRKLAGRYERVVRHLIANGAVKLREIAWLSEAERAEIVQQSRGEEQDWGECDVVQLFEAEVRRAGTAIAVICGDEQVSYEELNRRANQLAHYLRELGVGPEVKVGLLLPRSVATVVAVLGVLKAGAAYLPLELQAPLPRLAYILEDAQVPLLLTAETLQEGVPAHWGQTIYLDRDWEQISQRSEANPAAEGGADKLAYMIYTSGSSGRPKGALITRRGLGNYLSWALHNYPLSEGCGSPVHTPLSFDLTVTSLFTPLLSGKTVYLLHEGTGADALVEALQGAETYSLVKLTPSHLEVLRQQLTAAQAARCSRALVIGGEALYEEQVRWWREQAGAVRLFNEYGPTETVVGCCVAEVGRGAARVNGVVSIGRPISNTQMYVLDERLEVLPVGLVGELYIGGAGVCGGYWERAELTAERYLPDPFSARGGARLYRTGDAGRYGREGQVEYVGRLDEQVKVRGYRVELGEIEAELRAQGAVREAAVLLREDQPGSKRLVGYVVAEAGAKVSVNELRQSLQERLPEYMVPTAFVMVEELPLTVNGKVDRRALPAPDSQRPQLEKVYVGPRNEREEKLAGIWSQVLGVEKVGVHDNFFELGGDSIIIIKIIGKMTQIGYEATPKQIHDHPTIAALANVVSMVEASSAEQEEVFEPAPLVNLNDEKLNQLLAEVEFYA